MTAPFHLWDEEFSLPYGWDIIVSDYLSYAEEYSCSEVVDETGAAILAAAIKLDLFNVKSRLGTSLIKELEQFRQWLVPPNTPDKLIIWRGGHSTGMSWTLCPDIALRFANYQEKLYGLTSAIHQAVVNRQDILLILPGDPEQEVLIKPDSANLSSSSSGKTRVEMHNVCV